MVKAGVETVKSIMQVWCMQRAGAGGPTGAVLLSLLYLLFFELLVPAFLEMLLSADCYEEGSGTGRVWAASMGIYNWHGTVWEAGRLAGM